MDSVLATLSYKSDSMGDLLLFEQRLMPYKAWTEYKQWFLRNIDEEIEIPISNPPRESIDVVKVSEITVAEFTDLTIVQCWSYLDSNNAIVPKNFRLFEVIETLIENE